jgi:hypothetical protein
VTLGGHPAASWESASRRWDLTLDASSVQARARRLSARNPAAYEVKLQILDSTGDTVLGTWTLPPGFGGETGEILEWRGAPFIFQDGYRLEVEPHAADIVYRGPISAYARASWREGVWTIGP